MKRRTRCAAVTLLVLIVALPAIADSIASGTIATECGNSGKLFSYNLDKPRDVTFGITSNTGRCSVTLKLCSVDAEGSTNTVVTIEVEPGESQFSSITLKAGMTLEFECDSSSWCGRCCCFAWEVNALE